MSKLGDLLLLFISSGERRNACDFCGIFELLLGLWLGLGLEFCGLLMLRAHCDGLRHLPHLRPARFRHSLLEVSINWRKVLSTKVAICQWRWRSSCCSCSRAFRSRVAWSGMKKATAIVAACCLSFSLSPIAQLFVIKKFCVLLPFFADDSRLSLCADLHGNSHAAHNE